jgi:uncharacterized protein YndB with AHSA1/START domain
MDEGRQPDTDPLRCVVDVDVPRAEAFERFVSELGAWWPLPYTWTEGRFADAALERRMGGRWYEVDAEGHEERWGEVRAFEAPSRIVVGFEIGADRKHEPPERASEVELCFEAAGRRATRLHLEHRGFERHGAGAGALREGMARSWPLILASFAHHVHGPAPLPRGVRRLQLLALLFVALALIPVGAHLFELPGKARLAPSEYLTVQSIYRGWWLVGAAIVPALALLAAATVAVRHRRRAFVWSLAALLSLALSHAIFWLWTQPANVATAYWTQLPADFGAWRDQWELSHAAAAVAVLGALVALLVSIQRSDDRATQ